MEGLTHPDTFTGAFPTLFTSLILLSALGSLGTQMTWGLAAELGNLPEQKHPPQKRLASFPP